MARVIDLKRREPEIVPEPPKPEPAKPEPAKPEPVAEPTPPKQEEGVIRWTAPAFYRKANYRTPYFVFILLLVISTLEWFWAKDIIATILFALIAILVVVYSRRDVPILTIEIDFHGIKKGGKLYKYENIDSFWIHYEPENDIRELSIQFHKWMIPYQIIQLIDQNPVQLRNFLLEFIPEKKHEMTAAHTFIRSLGL